mgnify:CR=1 FL=1
MSSVLININDVEYEVVKFEVSTLGFLVLRLHNPVNKTYLRYTFDKHDPKNNFILDEIERAKRS